MKNVHLYQIETFIIAVFGLEWILLCVLKCVIRNRKYNKNGRPIFKMNFDKVPRLAVLCYDRLFLPHMINHLFFIIYVT